MRHLQFVYILTIIIRNHAGSQALAKYLKRLSQICKAVDNILICLKFLTTLVSQKTQFFTYFPKLLFQASG